jgi:predicted DNA-binding protein with PD1-like motif
MATASAMTGYQQLPRRPASCSNSKQNRASKSKPPVVIAHECPSAMRAHVVEVPAGRDVLSCVSAFARRGRRGALVLGAAGHVTDVVLREPALVLRGTMEILSLAGCFFPFPGPGSAAATGTAVFLAGPRGSVLGGGVALGGLVAAGPVVVMVATFVAAALDRLPLAKGEEAAGKAQQQGCDLHGHHRACGWAAVCRKQQQLGANS